MITEEEIREAADSHVFGPDSNHKWSNNDDTAGDNFGSFVAGAKWVLSQDQWISSNDRLPEFDKEVVIWNSELKRSQIDKRVESKYGSDGWSWLQSNKRIASHWMMPIEPPKK